MSLSYVITGANKGIGLEFVNQLSALPDTIVFAFARNLELATKLKELKAERDNVHLLQVDITNLEDLTKAAEYVSKVTGGSLDWLINNAAYIEPYRFYLPLHEYPAEDLANDLRTAFETNVTGVSQTINTFLPLLRAGKAKKVISLSSGIGDDEFTKAAGFAINAPYSISKYALNLTVLKYALALKDEGFIFLSIAPGLVDTFDGRPLSPEMQAAYMKIFEQFRAVYPDFAGPITTKQSVEMMLDVFGQLKPEHSGNYCSQYGPTSRRWL
ncbi:putative short-chain dehydrogenase [Ceratobasidium sp. AG-I]|nr:putative short-chain dehydrogenase [Ceratobasidium sp. AG-I]